MRVLAIDDDPGALWLVWAALRAVGHEAVRADAATDLMPLLAEGAYDAVVLDLEMPERSGFEILEELRRAPEGRDLPVLFLSAHSDAKSRVAALRRGADDYLTKPFEPEELILRLEKLVAARPSARGRCLDQATLDAKVVGGKLTSEVTLDRYRLEAILGEGAMGTVFLARDPRLDRQVVVKTLRLHATPLSERRVEMITQLAKEARLLASLSHPNIVAVYDAGDEGGDIPYITMEHVDGPSLEDVLRLAPLSAGAAVALGEKLAQGLRAAHEAGVLHRDIKPANVLLGRGGSVKLADFGVALAISRAIDSPSGLFGTAGYIAPEVIEGREPSVASDLFSLGALLYQCVVGRGPFPGRSLTEVLAETCTLVVAPPSSLVAGVPTAVDGLILNLLEKRRENRPPSSGWVAEELDRLARSCGAIWRPSVALLDAAFQARVTAQETSAPLFRVNRAVLAPNGSRTG